jgi:hypothetical protein
MEGQTEHGSGWSGAPWRIAGWSTVAALVLLPWVAMQFTSEVNWTLGDFVAAAVLLGGVGLAFEGAVRLSTSWLYRAAFGVALMSGLMLIWINLAVGIIGDEDNPANLMFAGVLALAAVGALVARFRAGGMALALAVTAAAQLLVGVVAVATGLTAPRSGLIFLLNGFFVALWFASAWLFRAAARNADASH